MQEQELLLELSNLKKQVYKQGFNIYALENAWKSAKKRDFPPEAMKYICQEFLKQKTKIRNPWGWLRVMLKKKEEECNANKEIFTAQKLKEQTNVRLLRELFG